MTVTENTQAHLRHPFATKKRTIVFPGIKE